MEILGGGGRVLFEGKILKLDCWFDLVLVFVIFR